MTPQTSPRFRLDKWLWVARFARTRTQAQMLCASGLVRADGVRIEKPSREIRPGDILTLPHARKVVVVKVLSGAERRGAPAEARKLYEILEG
jgi:ribosome-associated heat shock protein Hsp15